VVTVPPHAAEGCIPASMTLGDVVRGERLPELAAGAGGMRTSFLFGSVLGILAPTHALSADAGCIQDA
jgi:hypothetical protein